ncbi:MAG: rRNA maturation RNase YbeY [Ferruginibacter sp.]
MSVTFYELIKTKLSNRRMLKSYIPAIFAGEGKIFGSLSIIFCSDEYLLDMNRLHLNHDFYTDIITFDLSESKVLPIIGELYISVDRVKENAWKNDVIFTNELLRVIFHGALHLCGYGDKKRDEIVVMRSKEQQYLRLYVEQQQK